MMRRALHLIAAVALLLPGLYMPPVAADGGRCAGMGAQDVALGHTQGPELCRAAAQASAAGDDGVPHFALATTGAAWRSPRSLPGTPARRALAPRPSDPQSPGTGAAVR